MDRPGGVVPVPLAPRFLSLVFFALGVSSIITQVVILRELAASFYGNEFFTGWILFSWLLWTGLGSSCGSSRPRKNSALLDALAFSSALIALLSFVEVALIRAGRTVLGQTPGALPDLVSSLAYSLAVIGPVCFLFGMQFSLAGRLWTASKTAEDPSRTLGKAYLFETFGFLAGGLAFSFLLTRANSFLAVIAVITCNLVLAVLMNRTKKKDLPWPGWVILAVLLGAFAWASGTLDTFTAQYRFPAEQLLSTKNTLRANIAVTRLKGQHNFYQNGMLLGAGREQMTSEYLVHFPMLAHPAPGKVLLLGTGINGPIKEILKHSPAEVTVVEFDPEFSALAARYLPADLRAALADPRVRFWYGDGRAYFRSSQERFDVIIANFPDPLSILNDRNYTKEFFNQVRDHLARGGIFATRLGFAPDYVTPELERLGSSIYATLQDSFANLKLLPEDTVYFLAGGGPDFPDVGTMSARILERKLAPDFVTADYLNYRFSNDRVRQVTTAFENSVWKSKNTDLKPQSYYFAFARWLSQFHPKASQGILRLAEIPFVAALIALLIFFIWPLFLRGSPEGNARRLSLAAMRAGGFTVMAFEIVLIYLFQVCLGDLYYRIAVLVTAFMVGLGGGTWAAGGLKLRSPVRTLAGIHFLAVLFYAGLAMMIHGLRNQLVMQGSQEALFYGFAVLSGFLAGFEFPAANRLYSVTGKGEHVGSVYTADLFGACLGALLTAGFLVPVWGVKKTLILLISVNAAITLSLLLRERSFRK